MTVAKWIPGDAELDALARTLPGAEPALDRAEHNRTRMLAAAASVPQDARSSRLPYLAVGLSLAAAAAAMLWLVGRPDEAPSVAGPDHAARETIVASAGGRFDRTATWPDYQVRVHGGRVSFAVGPVQIGERFRVMTMDSEIEVRGARFVVEAARDRLVMVLVEQGTAEIRMPARDPVSVKAGERWSPPRTAQLEEVAPDLATSTDEPSSEEAVVVSPPAPAAPTTKATRRKVATSVDAPAAPKSQSPVDATTTAGKPAISVDSTPPAPVPVKPSEAEFRRGWALLRAGDGGGASKAFAKACSDPDADAREDACYWTGVAAKRAGQTTVARDSLARFIATFPSSPRAGEAAALLGWLLYDAGALDSAERRFRTAANDRVPSVRESAERGLTAIERRRKTP